MYLRLPLQILICFFIVFLSSCSTTPHVNLHLPPIQKYDLNVALIISDTFKNSIHHTFVKTNCGSYENRGYYTRYEHNANGSMHAKNTIGEANESLFAKGMPYLFNKVDIYKNTEEINKTDYDFILLPKVEINTFSEENLRRQIRHRDDINVITGTPIEIKAKAKYTVLVRDAKNPSIVKVLTGESSSAEGRWRTDEAYCSSDGYYNLRFSEDYRGPIGDAMSNAFTALLKEAEQDLQPLAEAKIQERALPSDLSVSVRFSDSGSFLPNNSLDAGENAEVTVSIKNTGKGTAFGTNLFISSDNTRIGYNKEIKVADIQPNEVKELKVDMKAGLDIGDGKSSFQFDLKEKRGYDAKKVIVQVPTSKLEKPLLEIVTTEINDGDTGLARGNGNGILESGETVELTAFVRNSGEGRAAGVNLGAEKTTPGIEWVRNSVLVGAISPSEVAKAKIAFSIPRNFNAKEISTVLKANDIRGVNVTEKKVALAYEKRSPDLQYAYRILSNDKAVRAISNGEEYEVELSLTNRGRIPAKNVIVSLSSGDEIKFSNSKIDAGEIKENASIAKRRFPLFIPRSFGAPQAVLNIEIAQAEFPVTKDSIRIPVDVKSPKLSYVVSILGRSGANSIEQGEDAVLEVQVLNEGDLPAENVRIRVESKDENLKISGRNEAVLGKIPALSNSEVVRLQLTALRRIKAGDSYLGIGIVQDDFPPVVSQYVLNVKEEDASVIDLASEGRAMTIASSGAKPPVINLKTIRGLETTADENLRLAFEVVDSRNVEAILVEVNGVRVPLDEKSGLTPQPSRKKEIIKNIPLSEGTNRVVITAYNSDNIKARKELMVTRVAEEDIDTPPVTNLHNPDALAVVIGISKYESIHSVDYAKNDAEAVRKYLVNTLGFEERRIKSFYDEQATFTKLRAYLETHLRNMVKPGVSDVFIFYSGHGIPENNEAYFAPYDLDPYAVKTSGYAVNELYRQLAEMNVRSVTVVIDACFSGISEGNMPVIKSASPVFLEVSNPILRAKNGVVFTSSTGKQISSWYPKKRHGLFTYYFLSGLRGGADLDNDGQITVNELERYIGRNVPEQARILHNREQTPEVVGNKDAVLVRFK